MPINPLIPLSAQAADTGLATNRLLGMLDAIPTKAERQQNRLAREKAIDDRELGRFKSVYTGALQLKPFLEQGDVNSARTTLTRRLNSLKEAGVNTDQTMEALSMLDQDPTGKALLGQVNNVIQAGRQIFGNLGAQNVPSAIQERNDLIKRLPVDEKGNLKPVEQMTAAEKAIAVDAGLIPRAVGSAAITTATTGLTDKVAGSEAAIAGAKAGASERAELDAQLEKLPAVKAAVTEAEERIKQQVEREGAARKNSITLNMYETAMRGLSQGLAGTDTGPASGRLPAITSNQQIAEGAVAAMAPILKSMFRTAGEGTFTDKDQELLLNMVPTRKDNPEAIKAKMQNIDAIVRAKLGQANTDDPLGIRK